MSASRQCPIKDCTVLVPSRLLMCPHHWGMCPKPLQTEVWRFYRVGQEKRGDASPMYYDAARNAIAAVNEAEAINHEKGRQCQLL